MQPGVKVFLHAEREEKREMKETCLYIILLMMNQIQQTRIKGPKDLFSFFFFTPYDRRFLLLIILSFFLNFPLTIKKINQKTV